VFGRGESVKNEFVMKKRIVIAKPIQDYVRRRRLWLSRSFNPGRLPRLWPTHKSLKKPRN